MSDPLVLVLAFGAFWFGGAAVMSRIAGWHVLSALYPAPQHLQAVEHRFASVGMGPASFPIRYRRCVRVIVNDDGMGLCLMFPFRFYSPAFFVPWQAVAQCVEQQTLATRKVTFHFKGINRQVTCAGELGQALKAVYHKAIDSGQAALASA